MAEVGQLRGVAPEYVDEIEEHFRRLFGGRLDLPGEWMFPLNDAREKVVEKAHEMVKTFNDSSWRYPLPTAYLYRHAIGQVLDALPQVVERIDYATAHYLPVISLYRAASSWSTAVMTPLSEVAATIDQNLDRAALEWQDRGRDIYSGDVVPHQRNAAAAAKDNAAYLSNLLAEIGQANIAYATELIKHVAEVYAQLLVIIIELGSIVGSPFALQDAPKWIGDAITSFVGAVADVVTSVSDALAKIQDAENELGDHTYFPGGEWPHAVERT